MGANYDDVLMRDDAKGVEDEAIFFEDKKEDVLSVQPIDGGAEGWVGKDGRALFSELDE